MKRIFALILPAYLFLVTQGVAVASVADDSAQMFSRISFPDQRVTRLEAYLKSHNSPLSEYAAVFVQTADKYELPDWRLVPAIAGVESTFGKAIPENSYNAYGWANGTHRFQSWEESIATVSKTLKSRYVDRGADTVEEIGRIYAPPSNTWAVKVRFFMREIGMFPTRRAQQLIFTL